MAKSNKTIHKNWMEKIQDWSTTKTSLFLAMIAVVIYFIISLIVSIISMILSAGTISYLDPTLTSEWFEFWKWVVAGGGTVSIFNILNTNNQNKRKAPKVKLTINEDEMKEEDINNE